MNLSVRAGAPKDYQGIRPLQKEVAELHHRGRSDLIKSEVNILTEDEFEQKLRDPKQLVFIAETDSGEVVGYAFAEVISYRNHPVYVDFDMFYIVDICVLEKYRRNGIGQKLFECCKTAAGKLGCKNIDLNVWSFNKEAIAFYEHCGMKERTRRMELVLEK